MSESKIEWTKETQNPITVEGGGHWCKKISPGCTNCYAEAINLDGDRFGKSSFASGLTYTGQAPRLILNRKMLASWGRRRVPKKLFICSMTDWCGSWIDREWQFAILDAMNASLLTTFQLLTKRADILYKVVTEWLKSRSLTEVPKHIWLGVSVENQQEANKRIPFLVSIPAATRFLSCEPLLEPITISDHDTVVLYIEGVMTDGKWDYDKRGDWEDYEFTNDINLVIVGYESGAGARLPIGGEDTVRSLRDQCIESGTFFFYKQRANKGKKISLPKLDGEVWAQLP